MNLIKNLKQETIEKLSELKANEGWKELVKCLRLTQENYGKLCLTRNSWEEVQKLQWEAAAFSMVIQMVEQAHKKINKGEEE